MTTQCKLATIARNERLARIFKKRGDKIGARQAEINADALRQSLPSYFDFIPFYHMGVK